MRIKREIHGSDVHVTVGALYVGYCSHVALPWQNNDEFWSVNFVGRDGSTVYFNSKDDAINFLSNYNRSN